MRVKTNLFAHCAPELGLFSQEEEHATWYSGQCLTRAQDGAVLEGQWPSTSKQCYCCRSNCGGACSSSSNCCCR